MGDKVQVVVEVVRDESPLAPAPPCESAAADLDEIIAALKGKGEEPAADPKVAAGPAPAAAFVAPAEVELDLAAASDFVAPAEVELDLAAASDFVSPAEVVLDLGASPDLGTDSASEANLPGDTSEAPGGLLDLGFGNEETDADLNPSLNVETLRAGLAADTEAPASNEDDEHTEAAGAPIPLREEEPEHTEAAGAPIPLREEEPPDTQAPGAPLPVREEEPEAVPGGVAPVAAAGPAEYTGDGSIVEYESDAQREAREEKELRIAARQLREEEEKAAVIAKAQAEKDAIAAKAEAEILAVKAARAEMDAKKKKREEARLARKGDLPSKDNDGVIHKNVQERVRNLTAAQQQKLARTGDQRERVTLERIYGKNVWESLLRNPKLTPPEAGRIARMGALPVPLIEIIVSNRSWLSAPQVRRALLSNPRLKSDMIMTVLRATPKSELKLMPKQMAYPAAVRQAAKKLIR